MISIRHATVALAALEESIGAIDSWHARDFRLMAGLLFHLAE